jgi:hypothetical protein
MLPPITGPGSTGGSPSRVPPLHPSQRRASSFGSPSAAARRFSYAADMRRAKASGRASPSLPHALLRSPSLSPGAVPTTQRRRRSPARQGGARADRGGGRRGRGSWSPAGPGVDGGQQQQQAVGGQLADTSMDGGSSQWAPVWAVFDFTEQQSAVTRTLAAAQARLQERWLVGPATSSAVSPPPFQLRTEPVLKLMSAAQMEHLHSACRDTEPLTFTLDGFRVTKVLHGLYAKLLSLDAVFACPDFSLMKNKVSASVHESIGRCGLCAGAIMCPQATRACV